MAKEGCFLDLKTEVRELNLLMEDLVEEVELPGVKSWGMSLG